MAQTEAAQALEMMTHESEYQDRPIKCVDCNENFIWTAGEQVFFHDKGLKNEPKRCKPCKQAKNERLAAIAAAVVGSATAHRSLSTVRPVRPTNYRSLLSFAGTSRLLSFVFSCR
jgi:hypothetical protein